MDNDLLMKTWMKFRHLHGNPSLDRVLCSPQLRSHLLDLIRSVQPNVHEEEILWAFVNLRKKKKLKVAS